MVIRELAQNCEKLLSERFYRQHQLYIEMFEASELPCNGQARKRNTYADDAKPFDGSDLSENYSFKEQLQFADIEYASCWRDGVVESIDFERLEDRLMIDLATGLQKVQLEILTKWFASIVWTCSYTVLVRLDKYLASG
jgi:hypothetical protein